MSTRKMCLPFVGLLLGWLGILAGLGWLAHVALWWIRDPGRYHPSDLEFPHEVALGMLAVVLVVASVGLLRRCDWGRRLYILASLATVVVDVAFELFKLDALARTPGMSAKLLDLVVEAQRNAAVFNGISAAGVAFLIALLLNGSRVKGAMRRRRHRGEGDEQIGREEAAR